MEHNVEKKKNKGQVTPTLWLILISTLLGIILYTTCSNEGIKDFGELLIDISTVFLIPLFLQIMVMEKAYSRIKRIVIAGCLALLLTVAHAITTFSRMIDYSFKDSPVFFSIAIFLFSITYIVINFGKQIGRQISGKKMIIKYEYAQELLKRIREKKKVIKKEYGELEAENDYIRNENQKLHDEKEELEDRLDKELNKRYIPIIKFGKLEIAIKKMER